MKIETDRLLIDDMQISDKYNYFLNISHDKKVLETFICRYEDNIETFQFDKYIGRSDIMAIRKKENHELIGIFVECDNDEKNNSLEVGYGIGSKYWGKGYMSEVLNAMIIYYFTEKHIRTVYASFFPENIASKRVMEKCGMSFSHVNKNELNYLGKDRDLVYYKIENKI